MNCSVIVTNELRKIDDAFEEFHLYIKEFLSHAKVSSYKKDLLTLLVNANARDIILTDQELIGNMFIFLFAGHETTSQGLCYSLILLALHPEIQEELFQNIFEKFGSELPDYSDDFSHVQCVFLEALRLYPPVVSIPKAINHDTLIDGHLIEKGAFCSIHVTLELHLDCGVASKSEILGKTE